MRVAGETVHDERFVWNVGNAMAFECIEKLETEEATKQRDDAHTRISNQSHFCRGYILQDGLTLQGSRVCVLVHSN